MLHCIMGCMSWEHLDSSCPAASRWHPPQERQAMKCDCSQCCNQIYQWKCACNEKSVTEKAIKVIYLL